MCICIHTLLCHSMEQNPSWVANISSARNDIPRMFWILKVHYRVHKSTPPVLILSHISPVQPFQPISSRSFSILSSHLSLSLPNCFFPRIFPTKTLYTPLLSPIRTTCPARFVLPLITRKIFGENYGLWSSSLCSLLSSAVTSSMYIWNYHYLSSRKGVVFLHLHM